MQHPPSTLALVPREPHTIIATRYSIVRVVGLGGYAVVYEAIDLRTGHRLALKEMKQDTPSQRQQFRIEAGVLLDIRHPSVVRAHDVVEDAGRLYLVMDFVPGDDLEQRLNASLARRRRALEEQEVLRWAIALCGGLATLHAHQPPVIHRDIKPANVKVTSRGVPVLIDFGLAKAQFAGPTRTAAQGVTPGYAPPEQYQVAGRTDGRSDLYGLGATIYACLTGRDPIDAPARLLHAHNPAQGKRLLRPDEIAPAGTVRSEVADVVMRALALDADMRPQTAKQMALEIQDALAMHSNRPPSGQRIWPVASALAGGLSRRGRAAVLSDPAVGPLITAAPPSALRPSQFVRAPHAMPTARPAVRRTDPSVRPPPRWPGPRQSSGALATKHRPLHIADDEALDWQRQSRSSTVSRGPQSWRMGRVGVAMLGLALLQGLLAGALGTGMLLRLTWGMVAQVAPGAWLWPGYVTIVGIFLLLEALVAVGGFRRIVRRTFIRATPHAPIRQIVYGVALAAHAVSVYLAAWWALAHGVLFQPNPLGAGTLTVLVLAANMLINSLVVQVIIRS